MKALSRFISEEVGKFSAVTSTEMAFAVARKILEIRRAELDSEWFLPTRDEESFKELRAKRAQLTECVEILSSLERLAQGLPLQDKPKFKPKPDTKVEVAVN